MKRTAELDPYYISRLWRWTPSFDTDSELLGYFRFVRFADSFQLLSTPQVELTIPAIDDAAQLAAIVVDLAALILFINAEG